MTTAWRSSCPRLIIAGITFALLYVYSGNLLFVVGVHGVGNWNMPLVETASDEGMIAYLFRLGVVIAWSVYLLAVRRDRRRPKDAEPRLVE